MSASTLVTNAAITNSLTPPSIANNTLSIPSELHFGFVATGCRGLGTWTGSSLGIQSRTKHSARANISRIALVFANYYGYNNIGGAASIMASVEYPSNTFTRILFRGQTQGTIPNGAFIVSDTNQLAQASKPAVSPVSKPAGRGFSITERNVFALVLSWGPPLLLPNHPEISGSSVPTSNQLEEQLAAHEYSN
jgi:hypothetical protein